MSTWLKTRLFVSLVEAQVSLNSTFMNLELQLIVFICRHSCLRIWLDLRKAWARSDFKEPRSTRQPLANFSNASVRFVYSPLLNTENGTYAHPNSADQCFSRPLVGAISQPIVHEAFFIRIKQVICVFFGQKPWKKTIFTDWKKNLFLRPVKIKKLTKERSNLNFFWRNRFSRVWFTLETKNNFFFS